MGINREIVKAIKKIKKEGNLKEIKESIEKIGAREEKTAQKAEPQTKKDGVTVVKNFEVVSPEKKLSIKTIEKAQPEKEAPKGAVNVSKVSGAIPTTKKTGLEDELREKKEQETKTPENLEEAVAPTKKEEPKMIEPDKSYNPKDSYEERKQGTYETKKSDLYDPHNIRSEHDKRATEEKPMHDEYQHRKREEPGTAIREETEVRKKKDHQYLSGKVDVDI